MNINNRNLLYLPVGLFLLLGLLASILSAQTPRETEQVKIYLQLPAMQANTIEFMGSFNNWQKQCCLKQDPTTGIWSVQLTMPPGIYEYSFIVDGKPWAFNDSKEKLGDGLGGFNAVLHVGTADERKGDGDV